MKRILIIKGNSQYEVLRIFSYEIAEAFEKYGYGVDIIDTKDDNFEETLKTALEYQEKFHYKIVFSFNGTLISRKTDSDNYVFDDNGTVYFGFFVDYPLHHDFRLSQKRSNLVISCIDKNHVNYVDEHYPNISKSLFMPHAIKANNLPVMYYEKRKIDVAFFGSYSNQNVIYEKISDTSKLKKELIYELIDYQLGHIDLSLDESLTQFLKQKNILMSDDEYRQSMSELSIVDLYIRQVYRTRIIKTLVDNNIKVHVYGNGWDQFECDCPNNLIVGGALNFLEVEKKISETKIVLNIMPWFKNGSHERVFLTMLFGAVSLTDSSKYILDNFTDWENIVLYSLERLNLLPEIVKRLLDNPILAKNIAYEGQKATLHNHTWDNRVKQILESIET